MTLDQFISTLKDPASPTALHPILEALWQDAKGNWATAHGIAQSREGSAEFDRLHAYLHRKEGDESNARYWYRRAGAAVFQGSLQEEWNQMAAAYLSA